MIWFDQTKGGRAGHRSGLTRVGTRLREELTAGARPLSWGSWPEPPSPDDWFLTAELFSESERPGMWNWLRQRSCRTAAIFHDAIPLRFPQITWPQSVARHPEYMKMLASFDRVFAVSESSRQELEGFWRWQGVAVRARTSVIALGADAMRSARVTVPPAPTRQLLLCLGIIEPRKNQAFLLEVCEDLWSEGLDFDLALVGRLNPHFGPPIEARIRQVARRHPGVRYLRAADDAAVKALFQRATALVFPTIAEGCGLPLLEALWQGVPCVCSDLPVLRENADAGGCVTVAPNDRAAWGTALRRMLTDTNYRAQYAAEAVARPLPTWRAAADYLRAELRS